jgi:TldD protein
MPWFSQFGLTEAAIRQVLNDALARGADDADVYFEHLNSTSVALSDGKVNRASTNVDLGLGVRVVVGDSVGYAYTEDLSLASMREAAQVAAEIAAGGSPRPVAAITSRRMADRYPVTKPWEKVDMATRVGLVRSWEQMTFAADPRVKKVETMLADTQKHVLIVRPDGRMVYDYQPMTRAFVSVTAESNGKKESAMANIAQRQGIELYSDDQVQAMVKKAIDHTMILFEAGKPPAGEMTVVLGAGSSGILLHEAIGHGLEADFNRKNISIYADKIGQRIAPKGVTVVDDGTLPWARGSINTDDEANPAEKTVMIEDGILRSYLHDEISARHYKVAPTGSGRRESFRSPVLPRMRATYMENGSYSPEEIIASVQNGIYCSTFSNGQVQIGAGDFAFYVRHGYLIENGKLTRPIKDVNIIGNGPKVLETVQMVGNDLEIDIGGWTCGKDGQSVPVSQGMPTVKVEKLSVGGAA